MARPTASHYLGGAEGGSLWLVQGSYEIRLVRQDESWQVSSLTFRFGFQSGNTDLPALAQNRAAA